MACSRDLLATDMIHNREILRAMVVIAGITICFVMCLRMIPRSKNSVALDIINNFITENYLLQPLTTAKDCAKDDPYTLIMVTSHARNWKLRAAHRRAMPAKLLKAFKATRVFIFAVENDQQDLVKENVKHGDLLQGNFEEHYRNLTTKHLMGLSWAARQCARASFILKVDDDVVFNLNKTYDVVAQFKNKQRDKYLLGHLMDNYEPKRNRRNRWYVSWEEFSRAVFPNFLSGSYYVTTPETAARLVHEAQYHPFLWVDDVFVTGILAEALNIELQNFSPWYWMDNSGHVKCCIRFMSTKNIKCSRGVGPNGGKHNLIVVFNRELELCNRRPECVEVDYELPCLVFSDHEGIYMLSTV